MVILKLGENTFEIWQVLLRMNGNEAYKKGKSRSLLASASKGFIEEIKTSTKKLLQNVEG